MNKELIENLKLIFSILTRYKIPDVKMDLISWPNAIAYAPLCGYAIALPVIIPAFFLNYFNIPPILPATFSLVMLVYLTGAMHLDGFADICDGFGCHAEKNKRLKIMHDPTVGSFGVTGIAVVLLVKVSSFFVLYKNNMFFNAGAIIILARTFIPLTAYISIPAEDKGLGALIIGKLNNKSLIICIVLSIPCFFFISTLPALIFMLLTAYVFKNKSDKLIGGLNGDGLGTVCELTESIGLFVVAIYSSLF